MTSTLPIRAITTYAIRIPRDFANAVGGAGTPTVLSSNIVRYPQASNYGTIYSQSLEAFLIRIEAGDFVGWGEAQAPIAPEVCQAIIEHIVGPLLLGRDATDPTAIYKMLYESMHVRGHWNGFFPDALAAVDIALWDIVGQWRDLPLHQLLCSNASSSVPTYISGLVGRTLEEKVDFAQEQSSKGATAFKIFWPDSFEEGFKLIERLRLILPEKTELFVDTLWRMNLDEALFYASQFARLRVGWFEAPLPPENLESHAFLAERSQVPIAIGECYRCLADFTRIADLSAASVLQPDLGRCGVTLISQIVSLCTERNLLLAPHVSISLGPQIAAAIHTSATAQCLKRMEINPQILAIAQEFLLEPLIFGPETADVPSRPGLGILVDESKIERFTTLSRKIS